MSSIFSNEAELLFKGFVGAKIVGVRRQIFEGDMDREDFEQNADGPLEVTLNSGRTFVFFSNTESFSVEVQAGEMPMYGESYKVFDLTNTFFWSCRVNREIRNITAMKSKDANEQFALEFGLQIDLDNDLSFYVEYIDEADFPDMIRVTEKYLGNGGGFSKRL